MALDLWGSRIWLNVSIFYQFHKAKSRYLSSEPGHWFKKQLSKFSWNQSKDLTFAQIFAFCDLNVIFDNSNWIECVYILKFQIGVNSKADLAWFCFYFFCSKVRSKKVDGISLDGWKLLWWLELRAEEPGPASNMLSPAGEGRLHHHRHHHRHRQAGEPSRGGEA